MIAPELLHPFATLSVIWLVDLCLGTARALRRREFRLARFCGSFAKLGRWFVIFAGCALLKSGLAGNYLLDFAGGVESGIILAEAASVLRTLSALWPEQFVGVNKLVHKYGGEEGGASGSAT